MVIYISRIIFTGRVQIYSPIGEKEGQFGGDLGYVKGIAINSNGTVFVAEWSGVGSRSLMGKGITWAISDRFGYPNFVAINSARERTLLRQLDKCSCIFSMGRPGP